MNYSQVIEETICNLAKERFENELDFLYQEDIQDKDRINTLELIIDSIKPTLKEEKKDIFFKEIDKLVYKKTWNRLQIIHRSAKMKEYLEENYKDKPYYNSLCSDIDALIQMNKLNTKKYIIYDPNAEKITAMPCLKIDEDEVDGVPYKIKV